MQFDQDLTQSLKKDFSIDGYHQAPPVTTTHTNDKNAACFWCRSLLLFILRRRRKL